MLSENDITAVVYKFEEAKKKYWVKITLGDTGLYITSFTVQQSPKYPEKGLWVQPPLYKVGKRWISPVEHSRDSALWKLLERLCIEAVDAYNAEAESQCADKAITSQTQPQDSYQNDEAWLNNALRKLGR